ncbi:MAG TPA: hypothetical protein VFM68_03400 [Candidatus Saccharimonadales bacterium]|nr:hypothetical protein [Candidatus Saccharimonadales bacterium]
MTKNQRHTLNSKYVSSNIIIIVSILVVVGSLAVIVGFDMIDLLSAYFSKNGAGYSSNFETALMVCRIPLILAAFFMAYGIGMKSKDKLITWLITLGLGVTFAIVLSVFVLGYINFILNYAR